MPAHDFDVIVAGAGAGGAAAACYLTQAGLRVLVIEKARLPRYKPCGGAIPRTTLARFPFACDGVVRTLPSEVRFTFPDQPPTQIPLTGGAIAMVMRSEFDAFLLSRSGAEVLQQQKLTEVAETEAAVQVKAGRRQLTARYLVGADGAASNVARQIGLRSRRQLGAALEAEVPADGLQEQYGRCAVFSLGVLPWGYAWVFPKGDLLSVGIGRFRPGRIDLHTAFRHEMDRLGIRLDGATVYGHPIPSYQAPPWPFWRGRPQEPLTTRRCVLVGDAAGLVDPFNGEGIRYAIKSARLAAEAIARDDLSEYDAAVWREIGHSLATAGLVGRLCYRFPRLCYEAGARNPATVRLFIDVLSERISYEGIGRRLIALTVPWLLAGRRTKNKITGGEQHDPSA